MISVKNAAREPMAGVNEAKICPKIAKNYQKLLIFLYIKCNNSNIIQYFNIFLCFTKKACLGSIISGKKVVIEPTAGVNEVKFWPKIAKNW